MSKNFTYKKRPVFLNLTQIAFPFTAFVSGLHRISGLLLFLSLPFVILGYQKSKWPQSLMYFEHWVSQNTWFLFLVWILLAALFYHLLAGLRHIAMDLGLGHSLQFAKISAWLVVGLTALLSLLIASAFFL